MKKDKIVIDEEGIIKVKCNLSFMVILILWWNFLKFFFYKIENFV